MTGRAATATAAILGLVILGAGAAPAGAAAQGPWVLPAFDLSAPGQNARNPEIAISPDGTATAIWRRSDVGDMVAKVATRPPGGEFGTPVDISPPGFNAGQPDIAAAPDGSVTAVWVQAGVGGETIEASTRPPGSEFKAPVTVFPFSPNANAPQIAIGPDGTTTVVASIDTGADYLIKQASRPAGGSFSAPEAVSLVGGDASSPKIAFAPDGTGTVVWYRDDGSGARIQQATRPPAGGFGPPTTLSAPGAMPVGNAFDAEIAFGPDGTATVVWRRFNGVNETIQASTRTLGGGFAAPVDLTAPGQNGGVPEIAAAPDNSFTAIWRSSEIQTSTRPKGGGFGPPEDLTSGASSLSTPHVAIAADGTTNAIWQAWNGSNDIIQASTRPPGGGFVGPVALSLGGEDAQQPQIATDSVGSATVIWSRQDGAFEFVQAASTLVPDFLLAVGKGGPGQGTVTSAPAGIDCGLACAITAAPYSEVTLTATPEPGSRFGRWGGACEGAAGPSCELTMDQVQNVTARFTLGKAKLKIRKIKPKKPKVKPGKRFRLKVVAGNKGDATAKGTQVCLKADKLVKKTFKVQKTCLKRGTLKAGATKSATFKLKATRKARGRSYKIKFVLSGKGSKSSKASVRVRMK